MKKKELKDVDKLNILEKEYKLLLSEYSSVSKRVDKLTKYKNIVDRAEKGYCDEDVWNVDLWFYSTLERILKEFIKKTKGYPSSVGSFEDWKKILNKMISLLDKINEYNKNSVLVHTSDSKIAKVKEEFFKLFVKYIDDIWY